MPDQFSLEGILAGTNSNFILKLRVTGHKDGTGSNSGKMHRLRLSQIQVNDEVSYKSLAEYVIRYALPEVNVIEEDYNVVCTYYDIDNDCVTISSTEELIDAVNQFSSPVGSHNNNCLRITAHVDRKKRPFLHCLHTCDGCHCSPIIGIRYHALNMPDLDFCSTCREKYQATDIHFRAEELERDRPWQNLWHEKWAKINPDDVLASQWARLSDDPITVTQPTTPATNKTASRSLFGAEKPSIIVT